MSGINGLYLVLLAAVAGYVLIARVPSILHTPMMSGSNFIHGIVLAGTMLALGNANGPFEQAIGFIAVTAAAANVVGGFIVTDRMLALFHRNSTNKAKPALAGVDDPASEDRQLHTVQSRPMSRSEPEPQSKRSHSHSTGENS